ncbi:uncharacterized protein LOC121854692 isoform X2 [Homarus americanus]|uniref:uncharacterized protein LOC121854692 isoform X2 n=1 Tax=Homarus americanus TaxID=6706 RepID=UPI001C45597F|nr:uncharacterized protein LOC121854692 isoform X2 [Homarus americanus]
MGRQWRAWACGWSWVVVWALVGLASHAYLIEDDLRVGLDSSHCELKETILHCDYKQVTQEVKLEELLTDGQAVQQVAVFNARKLRLSDAVCVNFLLENVSEVVVVAAGEGSSDCQAAELELSVSSSTLNRLPAQVRSVQLRDSSVTSFTTTSSITRLTIINSVIKILLLSQPLSAGSSASFTSTAIDTLQKLEVAAGATLTMVHTTIDVVASRGLILRGGNTEIKSSSATTMLHDSVLVGQAATLTIENHSGQLRVAVLTLADQHPCYLKDFFFWGFITSLVVLVVVCVVWVYLWHRRRKQARIFTSRRYFHTATDGS